MADQTPVNGVAHIRYDALQDFATPGAFKANPTLASGDVKVSIDGGAFANLGTLPVVTPAAGIAVKTTLSAAEMTGDNIFVQFIDQTSPKEWADCAFNIQPKAALPAAAGSAMTLTSGERNSVADALLDRADAIETGWTLRKVLRLISAALAGKLSGAATTTITIRDVTDAKPRITATVDADGNRSAVTLDGT